MLKFFRSKNKNTNPNTKQLKKEIPINKKIKRQDAFFFSQNNFSVGVLNQEEFNPIINILLFSEKCLKFQKNV
jgi:hypothetical protein